MQYDAFYCLSPRSKSAGLQTAEIWLYKDLTGYYRNKFPETKVNAVVIRYAMKD